jgi:integrase
MTKIARSNFSLSAAHKSDAREAIRLLDGSGLSLSEAARRAIAGKKAVKQSSIAQCVEDFMRSRLAEACRPLTLRWYEEKLAGFVASLGERQVDQLTAAELREWIASQPIADSSKIHAARAIRSVWLWATKQEPPIAGTDITNGLKTNGSAPSTIHFLTVEECAAIMAGAGDYRPALALMLFAGIRPHEIAGQEKERMTWAAVQPAEKIIRIPAELAKTGRTRIIEGLPAAVWAFLGKPGHPDAAICPGRCLLATGLASSLAGYGNKRKWPKDALRHTFATYAVAAFADPGQVSLWLGHNDSAMLYRHYRGLATKAEAKKFWRLRP